LLSAALQQARERGLDLVEVAPNDNPPVCRFLDYGRFRYLQTRRQRELRKGQHTSNLREVRFRPSIGEHDLESKLRTALKLLAQGDRVKVGVRFRGREITHPEIGMGLLRRFAEQIKESAKLEKPPAMEGNMMSIILAPIAVRTSPKESEQVLDGQEHEETESLSAETQDA